MITIRPDVRDVVRDIPEHDAILMFSGGRDSSIAAARLLEGGQKPPLLVTITSDHLYGIETVRKRIRELANILPAETHWLRIKQPEDLKTDTSFYEQTCLPCHHAYVVVASAIAAAVRCKRLAFGYARYQSSWPEQSITAVDALKRTLGNHGIQLELPVYDIPSKEAAIVELNRLGLSADSLEQKCFRQVNNVALEDRLLTAQVALWENAIDTSIARISEIAIEVLEVARIGGA